MINQSNIKEVLAFMGFHKERIGNSYKKNFESFDMSVNFDNKTLKYPEGVVLYDKNYKQSFKSLLTVVLFLCLLPLPIRLLLTSDGVFRSSGLPKLSAEAGGMDGGVCGIGHSISTLCQDSTWQRRMECGGCCGRRTVIMDIVEVTK